MDYNCALITLVTNVSLSDRKILKAIIYNMLANKRIYKRNTSNIGIFLDLSIEFIVMISLFSNPHLKVKVKCNILKLSA